MRNLWVGLSLVALLLSAGCDPAATPDTPEASKQPPTQSEEAPVETSKEENLANEVVPQTASPDEVPSVRESLRLPFTLDDEEDATVYVQKVGSTEVFELTPDQTMITLQTLRFTEPSPSTNWLEEEPTGPVAILVITSGENAYSTDFYYEKNALSSATDGSAGNGFLYAYDTQLSLILYELFEPETPMGTVGAFYNALMVDPIPDEGAQTEEAVGHERLTVEGKDYLGWEKELSGAKPLSESSYIGFEGELEPMAVYDGGVLKLNLAYAFTEPGYATPDGIEVGTTRDEVLAKLGAPNSALPDVWGYRIGDYLRFYLYFADDEVTAILLTMPL